MARKTVGYVQMEWTCPNCGTRNKGTDTVCTNCGAAQPADVVFEQAAQETLITDEATIRRAQSGPDLHCPFCGTRNPAEADVCRNCFGDLTEATRRDKGEIVGAHRTAAVPDVICPACGTENPGTATVCQNCQAVLPKPESPPRQKPAYSAYRPPARGKIPVWMYAIIAIVLFGCGYMVFLSMQRGETIGQVSDLRWSRTVVVEGLRPVEYEEWLDEIPIDAEVGFCRETVRSVSRFPQPNSREVCGTPYTVDTGTGIGQVVQDCEYEVYDELCEYTVDEWMVIDEVAVDGRGFAAEWPALSLETTEREAERQETYSVIFNADGRSYTYRTDDYNEFLQFDEGESWILEINGLNNVVGVYPDP